jgi:uncharacterized membrane protein
MIHEVVYLIADVIHWVIIVTIIVGFLHIIHLLAWRLAHTMIWWPVRSYTLHRIRAILGEYLMLIMEMFIVVDVILLIDHADMDRLVQLSIVVIIRVIISYFLQKELDHLHHRDE